MISAALTLSLAGTLLVAADGRVLGRCDLSPDLGLANMQSWAGDPHAPLSIYNREGRYGAPDSPWSPFNPQAPNPPYLVRLTPAVQDWLLSPAYQPGPATAAYLARSGGTRVTVSDRYLLRLHPDRLRRACAAP